MVIVFEIVCVLAVLVGVALVYLPAALILGGLVGVLAVEASAVRTGARGEGER